MRSEPRRTIRLCLVALIALAIGAAEVAVRGGVSGTEAVAIAADFLDERAQAGCGVLGAIHETAQTWRIGTRVGAPGTPDPEIVISKITGSAGWERGEAPSCG